MWVEVILCRKEGLRLSKSQWPRPVLGFLTIEETNAALSIFKRNVRSAQLRSFLGVSHMSVNVTKPIFDPQLLPAPPGKLLICGIEIDSEKDLVREHQQLWLCTPASSP